MVQNPGFANSAYPADGYSLRNGSPGVGFVVFDPNQAGRSKPANQSRRSSRDVPDQVFQSSNRLLIVRIWLSE